MRRHGAFRQAVQGQGPLFFDVVFDVEEPSVVVELPFAVVDGVAGLVGAAAESPVVAEDVFARARSLALETAGEGDAVGLPRRLPGAEAPSPPRPSA